MNSFYSIGPLEEDDEPVDHSYAQGKAGETVETTIISQDTVTTVDDPEKDVELIITDEQLGDESSTKPSQIVTIVENNNREAYAVVINPCNSAQNAASDATSTFYLDNALPVEVRY